MSAFVSNSCLFSLVFLILSLFRYMSDLLSQLNSERRSCARIRRLLKARKITDEISTYRQRVEAAKAEFLVDGFSSTNYDN